MARWEIAAVMGLDARRTARTSFHHHVALMCTPTRCLRGRREGAQGRPG